MNYCYPRPTCDGSLAILIRAWNGQENRWHNPLCRQDIVVAFLYHHSIKDLGLDRTPTLCMWTYHLTGDEPLATRPDDTNFINDFSKLLRSDRPTFQA